MKLAIANVVVDILAGIKLTKLIDKKIKTSLVKNYINLKDVVQKPRETKLELENKFREDWQKEIPEVAKLRSKGEPLDNYKAYVAAENDLIKMINDIFSETIEVEIIPIKLEDFITNVTEDIITLDSMAYLKESGIIID